jgi:hypothetical protein
MKLNIHFQHSLSFPALKRKTAVLYSQKTIRTSGLTDKTEKEEEPSLLKMNNLAT